MAGHRQPEPDRSGAGHVDAAYGLTADKAFAVLRHYSQDQNVKHVVLAEQITTTGQLPAV